MVTVITTINIFILKQKTLKLMIEMVTIIDKKKKILITVMILIRIIKIMIQCKR